MMSSTSSGGVEATPAIAQGVFGDRSVTNARRGPEQQRPGFAAFRSPPLFPATCRCLRLFCCLGVAQGRDGNSEHSGRHDVGPIRPVTPHECKRAFGQPYLADRWRQRAHAPEQSARRPSFQ